jgi:alpha-ribazole phosphatase
MTDNRSDWWWLRHAPTDAAGRMIGVTDLAAQLPDGDTLARIAGKLPDNAEWLVSPLARCRQTVDALASHGAGRRAARSVIEAFREQDFGD